MRAQRLQHYRESMMARPELYVAPLATRLQITNRERNPSGESTTTLAFVISSVRDAPVRSSPLSSQKINVAARSSGGGWLAWSRADLRRNALFLASPDGGI